MLIVTVAAAGLPALSVAVPVTTWPAPCALRFTGDGQDATPLMASAHVKVTVTAEVFHPVASGGGFMVAVMVGAVWSRLTVTEVEAMLPARSMTMPLTTWFAPSADSITGAGQDATPLVLS